MKKRYKVAEVAVDEDGTYWLMYLGTQPEQGGLGFGWGTMGFDGPGALSVTLKQILKLDREEHTRLIKDRSDSTET